MTGLLLATLLNLSPGIQLVDNVQGRKVALSEVRFRPIFISDDERKARPPFEQLSRDQLVAELHRVENERPGLGGPIAILAVGVALAVPGLGVTAIGLIGIFASTQTTTMSMGLIAAGSIIVAAVGFVMVTVGII